MNGRAEVSENFKTLLFLTLGMKSNLYFVNPNLKKMFTIIRNARKIQKPILSNVRCISFNIHNKYNVKSSTINDRKYEKSDKEWTWWTMDKWKILPFASLGICLVKCESYIHNILYDNRRFFRAAQYGSEIEIKK